MIRNRLGERSGTTEQRPERSERWRKVASGQSKKLAKSSSTHSKARRPRDTPIRRIARLGLKPDTDDDEFRAFSGARDARRQRTSRSGGDHKGPIFDKYQSTEDAGRTSRGAGTSHAPEHQPRQVRRRNHAAAVELTEQRGERAQTVRASYALQRQSETHKVRLASGSPRAAV